MHSNNWGAYSYQIIFPSVNQHIHKVDSNRTFIYTERDKIMYFDKFDICEAYYMFASLYHRGQWSNEYKILSRLCKISFSPRLSISVETLSENSREIFDNLVERFEYPVYTDTKGNSK
jgi:hypothetical protein